MAVFNPKELLKLYTRVKLTHNPSGYSFKDRLIECTSTKEIYDELTNCIDFDTEQVLLSKIKNFWKTTHDIPEYGVRSTSIKNASELYEAFASLYCAGYYICMTMGHSATLTYLDNMYFTISKIAKNLSIEDIDLKKNKALEALVTACYLLTTSNSITSVLKFTDTEMPRKYSYENLYSMQFLKEALETKNISELHTMYRISMFDNINCPVPVKEGVDNPCSTFANDKGFLESQANPIPYDAEAYKVILMHMYYETIAFGLEFAYIINRFTSTYTNRLIYEVCVGSAGGNDLTNIIYKAGKDTFEPVIELSDNPDERFNQIFAYLEDKKVSDMVECICDTFMTKTGYVSIPSLLGAVLSFAKHYSYRNIRIKQCAILYNYCKANKLIKSSDYSDSEFIEDMENSTLGASVLAEATEMEAEDKKRKTLLDLREERSSGKIAPGGGHESSSVSQALDGMIDNFRTEKYGFTVKDVYSDEDSLKDRYENICSHIKLVNTQLIKQIRDIKTYNVGGKYAGLSKGKIDQKNIHKYKTDKNIFYQNTYKQKECDLAFGIVLDASGSMLGRGIEDGRTTMIVLHETLKALGINHSIIDHTCYGNRYTSDLRRYQCFREDKGYKLKKNYALAGITAQSGNCDSGALWFMEKALLRTKNRDKICLIFSDGAPTECTEIDLVEQVRHMERNGIKVIGIGIGFPEISKYYPDYANGNNLKEMLNIVAGILKEYVIAKKD